MNNLATVEILRINGTREEHQVGKHILLTWIKRMIGCKITDVVNLRDGKVMIVDDTGKLDKKPVNPQGTEIYRATYPLARANKTAIYGDVAIATDEDFA